jgi:F-type H+-transporting ATPase subunit gamma
MKMVAASKLRRAQTAAISARDYASRIEKILESVAGSMAGLESVHPLLSGTGQDKTHLLVVFSSDRGLCGGFNSTVVRATRMKIQALEKESKNVKLLIIGRKAYDQLRRDYERYFVDHFNGIGNRKVVTFVEAEKVAEKILEYYDKSQFDVCTLIYNRFKSVISQELTYQQIIPLPIAEKEEGVTDDEYQASYEFEPSEEAILDELLPRNLAIQVFRSLLESAASEQGARMTAMDNATRNAGEMINKLTITYNRSRQAKITKELIEIISGAEAL